MFAVSSCQSIILMMSFSEEGTFHPTHSGEPTPHQVRSAETLAFRVTQGAHIHQGVRLRVCKADEGDTGLSLLPAAFHKARCSL